MTSLLKQKKNKKQQKQGLPADSESTSNFENTYIWKVALPLQTQLH